MYKEKRLPEPFKLRFMEVFLYSMKINKICSPEANLLIGFIKKEEPAKRLVIYNLKKALAALPNVQQFFDDITLDDEHQRKHIELCALEDRVGIEVYMCC